MAVIARLGVGIVVERQRIDNPWQDHRWVGVAVLPGAPEAAPWTVLADGPQATRYLAGVTDLVLHGNETENYKYNLESAQPMVYAVLRKGDGPTGWTLLGAT